MKAVPLDPSEVGAFYNGDSYLVLENRGEEGTDLHMWIGERQETHLDYVTCIDQTQGENTKHDIRNKSNHCKVELCIFLLRHNKK